MARIIDSPITWGRQLITSRDIDPVYDMLAAQFDPRSPELKRWLLAYWCFYHSGIASYLSDFSGPAYWEAMLTAAANDTPSPLGGRWPRSAERRHFRGVKCVEAILAMRREYSNPNSLVEVVTGTPTFLATVKAAQNLPLFGPWIAFKVADMAERVLGIPIKFPDDVAMYESPKAGAIEAGNVLGISTQEVIDLLLFKVADLDPPGMKNRKCGIQEVETILCKWKSARGGHYFTGKDIAEIYHGLKGWGPLADNLSHHLPKELVNVGD